MSEHLLIQGDARRIPLPDHSVHCVVTSPPYFNQRDYGGFGQIGREPHIGNYLDAVVGVFGEVARVLRPDGTCWLNLGDSYVDGSLMGVPWSVAEHLRWCGWTVRQEIIWDKPNPIPDTATNRPARSHETLFLLTRRKRDYFYDHFAVRQEGKEPTGVSLRTVWKIPVARTKGIHFATFPPGLVEPCILAGTSEAGCCVVCGTQVERVVERERIATRPGREFKGDGDGHANRDSGRHVTRYRHKGWRQACRCKGFARIPATVLDPFAGSCMTSAVAKSLGRSSVALELNERYLAQGRDLVEHTTIKAAKVKPGGPLPGQLELFPVSQDKLENTFYGVSV